MRYWLQAGDGDGTATPLFDASRGCTEFDQRILHAPAELGHSDSDEVVYVLAGSGELAGTAVREGDAAWLPRGAHATASGELTLLSVLVHDPEPANATEPVVVTAAERGTATAGREFALLATPEIGCASVTQFVGFIPPGRAPDHYHHYDEVVYVLDGRGELHIDGETKPLGAGSCVYLPNRLVHCLENTGDGEMRVLGVFRPAGSPAEAYYPDGTPAVVAAN